jgi:predicted metal-dependent peptidase
MHLMMHWIRKHSRRFTNMEDKYPVFGDKDRSKIRAVLNFIADSMINHMLVREYSFVDKKWEKFEAMGLQVDWDKESFEDIVEKLMDKMPKVFISTCPSGNCLSQQEADANGFGQYKDMGKGGDKSNRYQKGQIEQDMEKGEVTDMDKAIDDFVNKSLNSMKVAGVNSGALFDALLGSIQPPEVPWYKLIMSSIQSYLRSFVDTTWSKQARRGGDYMGEIVYTKPKLWVLVDTSGSISDEEMVKFYSETEHCRKFASEIEFVLWDGGILKDGRFKYKKGDEMKILRSNGGTTLAPVIRDLYPEFKKADIVIVMTDGYLADNAQAAEEIKKVTCKKILVTTGQDLEGFNHIQHIGQDKED